MTSRFRTAWISLVAAAVFPAVAAAQFGPWMNGEAMAGLPGERISADGSVTVTRPAGALRVHVELVAKGKTMDEALAKLKDRREAALAQLETLKADKASIVLTGPTLSNLENAQQRQMEAMVRQRMASRGRKASKGLKTPKSVALSLTLKAEWPLTAEDPDKRLLEAQTLQDKVKAADLGGSKEAEKPSPEEEEMAEEMAEMMPSSGEEKMTPGQPNFLYVARISEKDRQKALAEAFVKAKTKAGQLAEAAGVSLGTLVGLSGHGGGQTSLDEDMGGYSPRTMYMRRFVQQQQVDEQGQSTEAVAPNPIALTFRFAVVATFTMGKP